MKSRSHFAQIALPTFVWIGVSVIFAAVQGTTELEPSKPALFLLFSNTIHFGIWTLLLPLIATVVRRFPLQRGVILRRTAVLIPFCFVIAYGVSILYLTVIYFTWFPLRSRFPNYPMVLRQGVDLFLQMDLLAAVLIVSLLHAWSFLSAYRSEQLRNAELESRLSSSQLSALRMQLHPHFLFNTLNSIAGLVREDPESAREMIVALGDFLRLTLEDEAVTMRTLSEELEFVGLYISIERMRLGERMRVDYEIDPSTCNAKIPYLILQPLVENAIRHGVARIARPARICLRSQRQNGCLHLAIENDGPRMVEDPEPGVGISNTKKRLRLHYGQAYELSVVGREVGGCVVNVTIPFRN